MAVGTLMQLPCAALGQPAVPPLARVGMGQCASGHSTAPAWEKLRTNALTAGASSPLWEQPKIERADQACPTWTPSMVVPLHHALLGLPGSASQTARSRFSPLKVPPCEVSGSRVSTIATWCCECQGSGQASGQASLHGWRRCERHRGVELVGWLLIVAGLEEP
ncbi:uncharacterized protein B0I36DRAFT_403255 [Microdochium trichocladiopsis]|uniref:Uncharacterized protein n=1 Tax=Microdochium trichocladiopsis TaxID=1682393 RepID=A0A9P8YBP8_9PEZI|nr:uncharacterized protein B0I36DRAFT_403255 [Microdochium trichocladiopsis]KAH7037771.1 hypothetical protein B0I36DRAFT_403255 [Microdochium trichocladiopsis]